MSIDVPLDSLFGGCAMPGTQKVEALELISLTHSEYKREKK